MTDLHGHWAVLETRLLGLLAGFATLPTSDTDNIRHYIDHNEFGLAFEMLVDAIVEHGLQPDNAQQVALISVANSMGIEAPNLI